MEWPCAKASGYGCLYYDGKKHGVHRLVIEAWHGPAPAGNEACHTCDNRACVNPMHLYWGSRKDNVNDMMRRRRHWSHTWLRP